ncbi:hypothetical protein WJX82_003758 [Trebouxia sp. C0006]
MTERLALHEPRISPVKDEAEHVCQQQLPRLIGQLDYRHESIRTAFSCADVSVLKTCLFYEPVLSSYLAENLVELDLVAYGQTFVQHAIPLACISVLLNLEQLTMRSSCSHSHWQTQGALSSLTSLHTFKIKANATLHGDIISSLSHLPSLAHLELNTIPGGRLELSTGQFTAPKSFSKGQHYGMETFSATHAHADNEPEDAKTQEKDSTEYLSQLAGAASLL